MALPTPPPVPKRPHSAGVMQSVTGSQNPVSTLRKSSRKTSHFSVSSLVFPGSSSMRMQLFSLRHIYARGAAAEMLIRSVQETPKSFVKKSADFFVF